MQDFTVMVQVTCRAGEKSTHKLGPNTPATKSPQGVFVLLPDKKPIDDVRRARDR